MSEHCVCGHDREAHMTVGAKECVYCTDCLGWRSVYSEPTQPPQVAAQRRTPDVVAREVRKFALEQAVKMMPYLREGTTAEDVAAIYEDYILNGKADK